MPTAISPPSLTALSLPSNLLYRLSGLHPDGLHRASQPLADPHSSHARCAADRLRNPRWGFDYVVATIGPSWEMGTKQANILTQERHFLLGLKAQVSMLSKR